LICTKTEGYDIIKGKRDSSKYREEYAIKIKGNHMQKQEGIDQAICTSRAFSKN